LAVAVPVPVLVPVAVAVAVAVAARLVAARLVAARLVAVAWSEYAPWAGPPRPPCDSTSVRMQDWPSLDPAATVAHPSFSSPTHVREQGSFKLLSLLDVVFSLLKCCSSSP
jgi:hypothetical protein